MTSKTHTKNNKSSSSSHNSEKHQVFLTGFCPKQYSQQELHSLLLATLPGFKDIIVPKKVYNGFAFLELNDEHSKIQLLESKSLTLEGNEFIIKPVKKGKDLYNDRRFTLERKVFLSNIPNGWDDQDLFDCFSRFGEIEEAYACKEKSGKNKRRRVGFAVFKHHKVAKKVSNMKTIKFKGARVNVEPAFDRREGAIGRYNQKQAAYREVHVNQNFNISYSSKRSFQNQNEEEFVQVCKDSRNLPLGNKLIEEERNNHLFNQEQGFYYNEGRFNSEKYPENIPNSGKKEKQQQINSYSTNLNRFSTLRKDGTKEGHELQGENNFRNVRIYEQLKEGVPLVDRNEWDFNRKFEQIFQSPGENLISMSKVEGLNANIPHNIQDAFFSENLQINYLKKNRIHYQKILNFHSTRPSSINYQRELKQMNPARLRNHEEPNLRLNKAKNRGNERIFLKIKLRR